MLEFFMSRPEADRYSREHGSEVYHHSSRKYWLIADRTAYKDFKIMERATTLRSFDVVRQVR